MDGYDLATNQSKGSAQCFLRLLLIDTNCLPHVTTNHGSLRVRH